MNSKNHAIFPRFSVVSLSLPPCPSPTTFILASLLILHFVIAGLRGFCFVIFVDFRGFFALLTSSSLDGVWQIRKRQRQQQQRWQQRRRPGQSQHFAKNPGAYCSTATSAALQLHCNPVSSLPVFRFSFFFFSFCFLVFLLLFRLLCFFVVFPSPLSEILLLNFSFSFLKFCFFFKDILCYCLKHLFLVGDPFF